MPHESAPVRHTLTVASGPRGDGLGDALRLGVRQAIGRVGDDAVHAVVGHGAENFETVAQADDGAVVLKRVFNLRFVWGCG